jgi:hypothetical protein
MEKPDFFNKPPAAEAKPPEGGIPSGDTKGPVKMYRYRCVRACTFQKRYRKEGDIIELPEKREVPHFELVI